MCHGYKYGVSWKVHLTSGPRVFSPGCASRMKMSKPHTSQPKQDPATYGTSLGHLWVGAVFSEQRQRDNNNNTIELETIRAHCLAVVSPGRCYNCALNNGARCPGSVPAWAQPLPRSALHRAPRASVHSVHGRCGAPPPGGSTRRRRVRSRRALGGEQLTRRPAPPPW